MSGRVSIGRDPDGGGGAAGAPNRNTGTYVPCGSETTEFPDRAETFRATAIAALIFVTLPKGARRRRGTLRAGPNRRTRVVELTDRPPTWLRPGPFEFRVVGGYPCHRIAEAGSH
ncbi:hypothetical protein MPLSOD_40305 [Mesorhizobium sp. SOD10]|nr:hypothetical protein MPLSOD_40305 [Mesorhizobium sp. SOD10]